MSEHWLYILASIIIGAMLLLAVLGLGLTTIVPGMDKWSRRFFACFFAILSLCVCTFFVSPLAEGNPSMAMAQRIADYAESLLGSILIAMPMFYLTHCCNEDWRKSMIIRAVFVFWFAYFVFLEIA